MQYSQQYRKQKQDNPIIEVEFQHPHPIGLHKSSRFILAGNVQAIAAAKTINPHTAITKKGNVIRERLVSDKQTWREQAAVLPVKQVQTKHHRYGNSLGVIGLLFAEFHLNLLLLNPMHWIKIAANKAWPWPIQPQPLGS